MVTRPMIGITPGLINDSNRLFISCGYVDGIIKAGGFPILLPLASGDEILEQAIYKCDGFLISGGPDVNANYYGESNYKYNGEISPYRDELEILLVKKAFEKNKPVLGICRGMQILNVALGGTLYQDIYSQIKDCDNDLIKHTQEAPKWFPVHDVNIIKDSKVWNCFKKDYLGVNSFHHQAVKAAGKGLKITARAADGIIEAIEHESHIFMVGVQWHPEVMWREKDEHIKLFEAFVKACEEVANRIL